MLQALLRQSLAKGGRRAKGSSLFALRHLGLGGPFKGKNNHQRQQTRNKFTEVSTLLQHIPHHSNPKINELVKQYLADERNKTQSGDPGPDVVAPAPEGAHQSSATVINRVFTNNALALKRIDVIGCDYDYTLVSYTKAMEELIYDLAKDYLIEQGYPTDLKSLKYDPKFGIRGLAIDLEKGLLCKLSYIHQIAIRTVFRGRKRLPKEEVLSLYSDSAHVSPTYRDQHMKPLNDIFSLSEACLLADVLGYLIEHEIPHDPRAIVEDVLTAIGHVHTSGKMHSAVISDPAIYLHSAPFLRVTLQRFRDSGKQLFLCSNSDFNYVSTGLKYLLGEDWRDFFDVMIVSAGKPRFFSSQRPFRQIDQSTGKIRWEPVDKLEKGKVYSHGSMHSLIGLKPTWRGPNVLYFGDSIYADLVDARREMGWRTGAVIRELKSELEVQQSPAYRIHARRVIAVTKLLRLVQSEMEKSRIHAEGSYVKDPQTNHIMPPSFNPEDDEDSKMLGFLEKMVRQLNTEMSIMFNKNFGSVFRAEGEPTLFSFSLRRYVDIYTSRLENLHFYSPTHRFYPERGISNPHDPKIPAFIRAAEGGDGRSDK